MIYDKIIEETKTPIVFFPTNFSEVTAMAENLIGGCPIIINLTQLDHQTSLRLLDFICGVSYTVKARRSLLDNGVYLFSFTSSGYFPK